MSLYRNLWNISNESEEVVEAGGDAQVTAVAPEEAAEQASEVQEAADQVEQDAVTLEESEEAVAELEDQVETNEEVLENNPEAVTEDMVQASQENFAYSLGILGMPREYVLYNRVSSESGMSPQEKLRISTESVKEHVKNAIERIKLFFKQLGVTIKKLLVKVLAMFNTVEKRGKELIKDLKGDKLSNKTVEPVEGDAIYDYILNKGLLLHPSIIEDLNKGIKGEDLGDKLVKEAEGSHKLVNHVFKLDSLDGAVSDIKDQDPFEDSSAVVLRVFPHAVGVLFTSSKDDRPQVTYKSVKLDKWDITNTKLEKMKRTSLTTASVIRDVEKAVQYGRIIKNLSDTLGRDYDKTIKKLEKAYSKDSENLSASEKSKLKMQVQVDKIVASRLYSETALTYMAVGSAILGLANAFKAHKNKESK